MFDIGELKGVVGLDIELEKFAAIEELKKKPYDQSTIERDIEYTLKKLDLSKIRFEEYFKSENRFFVDYPSYYPLLTKFNKYSGNLLRMILPHKPMALFQFEMRKNQ